MFEGLNQVNSIYLEGKLLKFKYQMQLQYKLNIVLTF